MEIAFQNIVIALFTGVVSGIAGYFASYAKVKAEVRAATEDLKQTIQNLTETTRAIELEKSKIAANSALAADQRRVIYALAAATQSLVHSMCWLAWDAKTRGKVMERACEQYNAEAHKLLPEIFSQLAVLRLLDSDLHSEAYVYASKLVELDICFGEAIIASEIDNAAGVRRFSELFSGSNELQFEIDTLFGGKLKVQGGERF